tara:strand:- start:209 stop:463 length:255 start_codon:yes stop_codon:yes gene_type:complete
MKNTPLRIFDYTVTKDWNIEKAVEYERNIANAIRYMEMRGKPLTIEYIDDNQNVVKTLKYKGNKKKFLEYEERINKLMKGEIPE